MQYCYKQDTKGYISPVIVGPRREGNRQYMDMCYRGGALQATRVHALLKNPTNLVVFPAMGCASPPAHQIDIDTLEDFETAEWMLLRRR